MTECAVFAFGDGTSLGFEATDALMFLAELLVPGMTWRADLIFAFFGPLRLWRFRRFWFGCFLAGEREGDYRCPGGAFCGRPRGDQHAVERVLASCQWAVCLDFGGRGPVRAFEGCERRVHGFSELTARMGTGANLACAGVADG
jgi:hypothetical protein